MNHPGYLTRDVERRHPGPGRSPSISLCAVWLTILVLTMSLAMAGCSRPPPSPSTPSATPAPAPAPAATPTPTPPPAPPRPANPDVILATTTSTQDSGLLDVLIPLFEQKTGYKVKPVAVGSGAAMAMGQRGEADVLLVHDPDAEVLFMQADYGVNRRLVMHNNFQIVGPAADPAGVKGAASAVEAMKKIATAKSIFLSRGDNSGTNAAELRLWKAAGIDPVGQSWYQQSGQGMGATLSIASEKGAYTYTDDATYLARQKTLSLAILVEGDKVLLNVYHVIQVSPGKWPRVNSAGGKAFDDFMVAPETQKVIGQFGMEKYGRVLFTPDAGKTEAELGSA